MLFQEEAIAGKSRMILSQVRVGNFVKQHKSWNVRLLASGVDSTVHKVVYSAVTSTLSEAMPLV